jgi:hypothetical protein
VAFLIWIAVGLLVWHMLAKRWYQVHQRWLLSVAEREGGRNLAGRRGPRGFGYRFLRADRDGEIELRRRESLPTWRSLRLGFYVFAICWLGGGFSLLMLLR